MPRALSFPYREEIVRRHQAGEPLSTVAQSLHVPYATAKKWWGRYRAHGEAGLQSGYPDCGPQGARTAPAVQQAALALRQEHPTWGAGLIRLQLLAQFPTATLPRERTLQRWFRAAGLQPPRAKRPPIARHRGQQPHAVWEVDAKERMRLRDGSGTSVLSVTDEATGAVLGLVPFPPVSLEPGAPGGGAAGLAATL
jgi:transposase